jgi:hypothetical protein
VRPPDQDDGHERWSQRRIEAARLAHPFPEPGATEMQSEGATFVGIVQLALDLYAKDRVATGVARRAAVELAQDYVPKARAVHDSLLRGLPTDEHIVGAAPDLAYPPVDEELVVDDQEVGDHALKGHIIGQTLGAPESKRNVRFASGRSVSPYRVELLITKVLSTRRRHRRCWNLCNAAPRSAVTVLRPRSSQRLVVPSPPQGSQGSRLSHRETRSRADLAARHE